MSPYFKAQVVQLSGREFAYCGLGLGFILTLQKSGNDKTRQALSTHILWTEPQSIHLLLCTTPVGWSGYRSGPPICQLQNQDSLSPPRMLGRQLLEPR